MTYRRMGVQLQLFITFDTRWRWMVTCMPQPLFHRERATSTQCTEGWVCSWASLGLMVEPWFPSHQAHRLVTILISLPSYRNKCWILHHIRNFWVSLFNRWEVTSDKADYSSESVRIVLKTIIKLNLLRLTQILQRNMFLEEVFSQKMWLDYVYPSGIHQSVLYYNLSSWY
jgi:hypothetical protein